MSNANEVTKQMQDVINQMNEASDAYYNGRPELMSNKEWDDLFDSLAKMEKESGITLPDSPTQKVGADVGDDTPGIKVKHEYPALSLDKTKDVNDLIKWAGGRVCYMSWKEDGLTVVCTYDNGKLTQLVTRGDGIVGTDITHLKDAISGIPKEIAYKGHFVVRGECVISYADFERINASLPADAKQYDNARNLASGTLGLKDVEKVKSRNPHFIAFTLVHTDDTMWILDYDENSDDDTVLMMNIWSGRMRLLDRLGFDTVPRRLVLDPSEMQTAIDAFTAEVPNYSYPVDGLVICYEDWDYSQTGSVTGHHATRAGYAFKWADETAETVIRDIEWSDSRTGLYNPVAIFDPVRLCGTTVSRASLFNLSYVRSKDIKIGDNVTVYKANMIIPQVDKNMDADVQMTMDWDLTRKRHNIPDVCPHCGTKLVVKATDFADVVMCTNKACPAKTIGSMIHFCERDCMNIMGLSEKKLKQLIDLGIISRVSDIPELYIFYNENNKDIPFVDEFGETHLLSNQPGWGKDSVDNLATGIQTACENATFIKFMHAMGIPNIGRGQAKLLAPVVAEWMKKQSCEQDMMYALGCMIDDGYDFTSIDGIGDVISDSLTTWGRRELVPYVNGAMTETSRMLQCMTFTDKPDDYIKVTSGSPINSKTFVVTGDVHIFKNRKEVEAKIEELGGKLAGSVSKKTDYLINNDIESTSSKNQKAKTLGVPIITEKQFCDMIGMK